MSIYHMWKGSLRLKRLLGITPFERSHGEYDALYDRYIETLDECQQLRCRLEQELIWKDELAERVRVLEQAREDDDDEWDDDDDEITIGTAEEAYAVSQSLWDEEAEAAFLADESNHCYVDENGIGPIIELP